MKYLVISDIHGSFKYLSLALEAFKYFNCDKIICLGDILYHGPRNDLPEEYQPKKCIEKLNELADKIIAVRGNCDAEVDQMVLNFKIEDPHFMNINGLNIFLTHGHHLDELPKDAKIVFHGHDHLHKATSVDGVFYFDPGSISIPKGDKIHSFGLVDENEMKVLDFSYNVLDKVNISHFLKRS